jgi:hypothetical protein
VSKSYRDRGRTAPMWSRGRAETFRCRHCKRLVGPVPSGGKHRNHCPYCLYSRHVDGQTPGDRASDCGGAMPPVAVFTRPNGEYVLIHCCLGCGFERYNRIAADDDFELVLALPTVQAPHRDATDKETPMTA